MHILAGGDSERAAGAEGAAGGAMALDDVVGGEERVLEAVDVLGVNAAQPAAVLEDSEERVGCGGLDLLRRGEQINLYGFRENIEMFAALCLLARERA